MPQAWRNRLVLGLAGVAPHLDEFKDVACRLKGGYRIIHEFLLRAPAKWDVADDLLALARNLQADGTIVADDKLGLEKPPIKLTPELLTEFGATFRSDAEARHKLRWMYEEMKLRVGTKLTDLMLDEQMEEFQALIDDNDQAPAFDFLDTSLPEHTTVVRETFAEIKERIKDGILVLPPYVESSRGPSVLPSVSGSRRY